MAFVYSKSTTSVVRDVMSRVLYKSPMQLIVGPIVDKYGIYN